MKLHSLLLCTVAAFAVCACGGGKSGRQDNVAPDTATTSTSTAAADTVKAADGPSSASIKFSSNGSILPSGGDLNVTFKACAYRKAQVTIKKVYPSNILQFLQLGTYERSWEMYKIADVVADTTIVLGAEDDSNLPESRTYALDLQDLIRPETGAVYHFELQGLEPTINEEWDSSQDKMDLLASDLTLIVKHGDKGYDVTAMNIRSGKPARGVKVRLYSFTQQELAKGSTDSQGRVVLSGIEDASFATAVSGKNYAYLRLDNGKSLSTSGFDVAGSESEKGLRAYVFGERGVWRPGDTLHVSTIVMDDGAKLPAGYPVIAELRNPSWQVTQTLKGKLDGSSILHFPFTTEPDAPTGRWNVTVKIGDRAFNKMLRVETIRPNNLDIKLKFGSDQIKLSQKATADNTAEVDVAWMYGGKGTGLKVNGEVSISSAATSFKGYEEYTFKDAQKGFSSQNLVIKDMVTDDDGRCSFVFNPTLKKSQIAGKLNAAFTMTAYEPQGGLSTAYRTFTLSPFESYVGLRVDQDKNEWGEQFLQRGKAHKFHVVTLDSDGRPVSLDKLRASIVHVDWSWWWNAMSGDAAYASGSVGEVVHKLDFSTRDGKGGFTFDFPESVPAGAYLIRVEDLEGQHSSTLLCQALDGSGVSDVSDAATRLNMVLDKDRYEKGGTARLTIPSADGALAIVSIEKGGQILNTRQIICKGESTLISIPVTSEMAPNAYACVTLVQPLGNDANDAPVRLYGIANINVDDKDTHLSPILDIPDKASPESRLKFTVREKDGKAMSYVVALVDEGLLSLTGFKTPDAWETFYAKQALRVRTWDQYDEIIGAYGGEIEKLFAIGGSDEAMPVLKPYGADRFPPVVRYLGPFNLKKGRSAQHSVDIPQYIGALRAMVIATDGKAQGSFSKDVTVSKPMMVQANLPRVLRIGEEVSVPVTVIANEDGIGTVKLNVEVSGPVELTGSGKESVTLTQSGSQTVTFRLKANGRTGVAKFTAVGTTASDKSVSGVEFDVMSPNPETSKSTTLLLAAGGKKDVEVELNGIEGSNSLSVELSSIESVNLEGRVKYLTEYPYGCAEQTISKAFPQLYIPLFSDCSEDRAKLCSFNVTAAINSLGKYRTASGGLAYWPGTDRPSLFCTSYALHFLCEAENAGFAVPSDLKNSLVSSISASVDSRSGGFENAYALYALVRAGAPRRSLMNMMRTSKGTTREAMWILAAAYATDGKADIARQITSGLPYVTEEHSCYGSDIRNMAIALKTSLLTGDKVGAMELCGLLSKKLNGSEYMSTQSTAWALQAVASYARTFTKGIRAGVTEGGKSQGIDTDKSMASVTLRRNSAPGKVKLNLENRGDSDLHVVLAQSGVPAAGSDEAYSSKLSVDVKYRKADGTALRLGIDSLKVGDHFCAVATVRNNSSMTIKDIALSQLFPSGWEIVNTRIGAGDAASHPAGIDYQDYRDESVNSFFGLGGSGSVTVTVELTAAYRGRFHVPATSVEAMYDNTASATCPGMWIEIF